MKRLVAVVLFITLFIGFTGVASAADWRTVIPGFSGTKGMFFDAESFEENKSLKTYTVLLKREFHADYAKKLTNENKYEKLVLYSISKMEFNPAKRQVSASYEKYYDENDQVVAVDNYKGEWVDITAGSVGDSILSVTYEYYKKNYLSK